jgi:hypothetical protein
MIRSILAIVAGLMVASVAIAAGELVRGRLNPPAKGYTRSEEMEIHIERARRGLAMTRNLLAQGRYEDAYLLTERIAGDLPISEFMIVLLSSVIGTVPGAWLAASLARRAPKLHGLAVGALLLAAGFVITLMVPHLWWYWVPGEAILLPAAYVGARLGARSQCLTSQKSPINVTNNAAKTC